MKQTIFETRQRAEELLREAINIWRQSDDDDKLEGLENDPVLKLMITALAYQTNESISDLEMMKTDVLEEYAHLLTPYEVGHAVPATAVIETALQESVAALEVNEQSVFTLNGTDFTFLPLLKTRLLNAKVASVVRLDGRRFKCMLDFSVWLRLCHQQPQFPRPHCQRRRTAVTACPTMGLFRVAVAPLFRFGYDPL